MDDDLDLIGDEVEQPTRLDDLQPLVHQRSGVDGDLGAHLPRRVSQRVLHGHRGELVLRQLAEGAA
jgi:hypothetical protein